MQLTENQLTLVRETWQKIIPIQETATELFYARLFEISPAVKESFAQELTSQGHNLISMLNYAINALGNWDTIAPKVMGIGRNELNYGAKDERYDSVAEALLWTLATGMGDDFTDEAEEAWVSAYFLLAANMGMNVSSEI